MLECLTLTGIDARCDVSELKALQEEYPQLEYGVLLSKTQIENGDNNRYPDLSVIKSFIDGGLNVSCHVCGSLARSTMRTGNFEELRAFLGDLYDSFKRLQFNINGCRCSSIFRYKGDTPIIIQAGTPEGMIFYKCMNICDHSGKVSALVDSSGGRGEFSGYFDKMPEDDEHFGFAGGLGVGNVSRVLIHLNSRLGGKPFWIDMESSVRTDDWFDIDIARKVCEIVFKR